MLFKQENKKFVVREDGTEREIKVCKHIRYANDYVRLHSNVHVSVENAPLPTPECGECVVYLALYEEGGCTLKEACYNHCYKCSKGGDDMVRYYVVDDDTGERYNSDGYDDIAFAEEVWNRLNREAEGSFSIYTDKELEEMGDM